MPGADRFVFTQGGFLYHPSSVCVLENPMSEFSTGFCSFHLLHTSHVTGASVLIRSHHVKNILHNVIYTFCFEGINYIMLRSVFFFKYYPIS